MRVVVARRRFVADSEKAVQTRVAHVYAAIGAFVVWTSQYRASRVTPGLPDLLILLPRGKGIVLQEVKRPGGRQSAAQKAFQDRCADAGVRYVLGGVDAAWHVIEELGFVYTGFDPAA